ADLFQKLPHSDSQPTSNANEEDRSTPAGGQFLNANTLKYDGRDRVIPLKQGTWIMNNSVKSDSNHTGGPDPAILSHGAELPGPGVARDFDRRIASGLRQCGR